MTEPQALVERLRQQHQELLIKAMRLYEEAEKEAETLFEHKNPGLSSCPALRNINRR